MGDAGDRTGSTISREEKGKGQVRWRQFLKDCGRVVRFGLCVTQSVEWGPEGKSYWEMEFSAT